MASLDFGAIGFWPFWVSHSKPTKMKVTKLAAMGKRKTEFGGQFLHYR
ncbi:hypothetical protein COLO4_38581 [Corchorus olitorius]|uniref:Uncharacterized protein n=1 Tax=Corchorus olitorius TaxID=93759 RepID=A0A1R3FUD4_9ROSI|nr:hypothetical protein COLO4_38581 [Corchorus olitorius]